MHSSGQPCNYYIHCSFEVLLSYYDNHNRYDFSKLLVMFVYFSNKFETILFR